jgi:hypothetical protein
MSPDQSLIDHHVTIHGILFVSLVKNRAISELSTESKTVEIYLPEFFFQHHIWMPVWIQFLMAQDRDDNLYNCPAIRNMACYAGETHNCTMGASDLNAPGGATIDLNCQ